jgi:hypothetical protein
LLHYHCSTVVISVADKVDRLEARTALLQPEAELDAQQKEAVAAVEPVAQRAAVAAAAEPVAQQQAAGAAADSVAQQQVVEVVVPNVQQEVAAQDAQHQQEVTAALSEV